MSKRPLSYRLGLYISVAVLFVYSLFIIWVYKYNYMLAERDALNKALTINNSIVNVVREKIISTQEIAANMAAQIPFFYLHEKTSVPPKGHGKIPVHLVGEDPYETFSSG